MNDTSPAGIYLRYGINYIYEKKAVEIKFSVFIQFMVMTRNCIIVRFLLFALVNISIDSKDVATNYACVQKRTLNILEKWSNVCASDK